MAENIIENISNGSTYKLNSLLFKTGSDYNANLQTLLKLIEQTPKNSLIVAPEVCLSGFDYDNFESVTDFAPYAIEEIKKASKNKIIILTIMKKG